MIGGRALLGPAFAVAKARVRSRIQSWLSEDKDAQRTGAIFAGDQPIDLAMVPRPPNDGVEENPRYGEGIHRLSRAYLSPGTNPDQSVAYGTVSVADRFTFGPHTIREHEW